MRLDSWPAVHQGHKHWTLDEGKWPTSPALHSAPKLMSMIIRHCNSHAIVPNLSGYRETHSVFFCFLFFFSRYTVRSK